MNVKKENVRKPNKHKASFNGVGVLNKSVPYKGHNPAGWPGDKGDKVVWVNKHAEVD